MRPTKLGDTLEDFLDGAKIHNISPNASCFCHSVQKVDELPFPANQGDIMFVESERSLYLFMDNKWVERRPVEENIMDYAEFQKRVVRQRAVTRKLRDAQIASQMAVAPHYETYGKKKEPEVIGERKYNVTPYADMKIPVIFGVFGVEIPIGTKMVYTNNPEEVVYAREYEIDEDRLRVNISNLLYYLFQIYNEAVEFAEPNKTLFKNSEYKIKFPKAHEDIIVIQYKEGLFWKTILSAKWEIGYRRSPSNVSINEYKLKDNHIPLIKSLVELLVHHVGELEEIKNKKAEEKENEKATRKIFYDLLGI